MSYGANSLKGLMKPKGHGEIKNRVREREPYRMQEQQRQRDTAVGLWPRHGRSRCLLTDARGQESPYFVDTPQCQILCWILKGNERKDSSQPTRQRGWRAPSELRAGVCMHRIWIVKDAVHRNWEWPSTWVKMRTPAFLRNIFQKNGFTAVLTAEQAHCPRSIACFTSTKPASVWHLRI